MAGDLVTARLERRERFGVAGQRAGHAEDGQRQFALIEHPQHAPQPGARAVLVERLHAHVSVREGLRANDFREERLGGLVTVEDVVLTALLVVEDELHRDVGAVGPLRMGRVSPVPHHVARIVIGDRRHGGIVSACAGGFATTSVRAFSRRGKRARSDHDLAVVVPPGPAPARPAPLLDAAKDGQDVLACYVLDPRLRASAGPRRLQYLYDSLRELRDDLDGKLLVTEDRPEKRIPALVKEIGATSVHVSEDFTPFGTKRDAAVREALGDVPLEESGSPYLVSPGRVTKDDGTPYKVFTPFFNAWKQHGWRTPARTSAKTASWIDPSDVSGGVDI